MISFRSRHRAVPPMYNNGYATQYIVLSEVFDVDRPELLESLWLPLGLRARLFGGLAWARGGLRGRRLGRRVRLWQRHKILLHEGRQGTTSSTIRFNSALNHGLLCGLKVERTRRLL
jgi:hypothetical protein